ncbi:hypothetical protein [Achromobacter sp. DH1f]|uniref:hypothetical protein n=1 Tax=Achromobacter sp. DH1f TaxID=1397275 RepID=UPI000B2C9C0E|nr:hypothetical protein [Achromobacter sp. DH1f]
MPEPRWPRAAVASPFRRRLLLGVELACAVEVTATCIRFFDAAGRLRVVIGALCFSP